MSTPYEKDFQFDAVSGQDNFVELGMPHRGNVQKLVLVQLSGPLDGFDADLYNSRRAVAEIENSSESSMAAAVEPSIYQIVPTQVVAAAADRVMLMNVEHPYVNRDGTPTNPVRKLYLRIRPDGAGTKAFHLALGVDASLIR